MFRRSLLLIAAFLAPVLALTLTAPIASAAQGAPDRARKAALVTVTGSNSPFSPNADGSKDRGAVSYRLGNRAFVTVNITGGGSTVLTTNLGRVRKGDHTFTWDGRRAGRLVNDGTYTFTVLSRAKKHGRARVASTRLVVDARTTPDDGNVRLSSDTVYPRTTVIQDEVVGNFFPGAGFNPPSNYGDTAGYATVRRLVLNASGRIVDSAPLEVVKGQAYDTASEFESNSEDAQSCAYSCGRFAWDGRDSRGAVVPAGTYRIRLVRGRDRAGNVRVMAPEVVVQVSTTALVPTTRTTTLTPAGAPTLGLDLPHGCNGCGEVFNPARPSTRFDGGLTYDTACRPPADSYATYCSASDEFVLPFIGRRTPSDRLTVTARGGPTTPGGADTGTLGAGDGTTRRSATMQGDTTVTLADEGFAFNSEVLLPRRPSGLRWLFRASPGSSYDLASLVVTYTTYEPVS